MQPPRYDTPNFVTPRGDEGDKASCPLPTFGHCDESQNLPAAEERAADPDSAWRRAARTASRGSGRRQQWAVRGLRERPQPAPGATSSNAQGTRGRRRPPAQKKELAALQKSWTNFSGDDGCGRGEWDWGVAPTPPAPRSWNVRSEAAERPPTPRFPPPRGQEV